MMPVKICEKQASALPVEVARSPLTVLVMADGQTAMPYATLLYRVIYSDYTEKIEYGVPVYTVPTANAKKLHKAHQLRPDLFTVLNTTAMLLRDIEAACREADAHQKFLKTTTRETRKK